MKKLLVVNAPTVLWDMVGYASETEGDRVVAVNVFALGRKHFGGNVYNTGVGYRAGNASHNRNCIIL